MKAIGCLMVIGPFIGSFAAVVYFCIIEGIKGMVALGLLAALVCMFTGLILLNQNEQNED